jgi:hypothetical protein
MFKLSNTPPIMPKYQYRLLQGDREIRLLKVITSPDGKWRYQHIHIELHEYFRSMNYEAVSYVWGTNERNRLLPILDEGTIKYIPITEALEKALPFLSHKCSTGFL